MDEADAVGEKIVLFAHGKLRAVGSSLHLKQRFGGGYRLTIVTEKLTADGYPQDLFDGVGKYMPDAKLVGGVGGTLIYSIPTPSMENCVGLVQFLDNAKFYTEQELEELPIISEVERQKKLVVQWGFVAATLEDVFMNVIAPEPIVNENDIVELKK